MINGMHAVVFTKNAAADRAFLRDILSLPNIDAGNGWLIFGLPPSEIAFHPGEQNDRHELYFMCDDVEAFIKKMREEGIACGSIKDEGWGLLSDLTLPGGGKIGVYQPRHERPGPAIV